MPRILHLSMLYPPHILGGAEKSVALLAEAQAAAGHTVAAACITPIGWAREERGGVSVFRMPHESDFWPEEWPQHSAFARSLRRIKQPFNYSLQAHFARVLDEFQPDLVHTHSLVDVTTRVWLEAQSRGLPIVHTLRDFDLVCANASLFRNGRICEQRHLYCKVVTCLKRTHHRAVTAVVGVGKSILSQHLSFGYFAHVPEHLRRVIWNPAVVEGVPSDYVRPSRGDRPITFGYLGRINREKGVVTLLDACRQLEPDSYKLLIAGKEVPGTESLLPLGAGLPVEWLGFVPTLELLSQVDVLVVPSIWPEPLPRTILEAYAMGVPAVGANSGGIPDLIGSDNHAWLFPPGDARGLAGRLRNIIRMGRSALPGRDSFSHVLTKSTPARVVSAYGDLYAQVMDLSLRSHSPLDN